MICHPALVSLRDAAFWLMAGAVHFILVKDTFSYKSAWPMPSHTGDPMTYRAPLDDYRLLLNHVVALTP